MLDGIVIKPLKKHPDERGFFTELMRADLDDVYKDIVQANMSVTYSGTVRAWHRHERGQVDCFVCVRGAIKIGVFDDECGELDEIVSIGSSMQVVRVPGHYWHGFKAIGSGPATLVYFTNQLYDYEDPDEVRRPWDDPAIVPTIINGRKDDPRCGKVWDWLRPPHK